MEDDATTTDSSSGAESEDPVELAAGEFPRADDPPAIAGYELLRVIGRGGMGVVWEAIEHRLDRRVALKVHVPFTRGSPKDALWTEALVAARIGDPSIVGVLDVGFTLDGRPYYAMELASGTDLAAILADGPIPPRRALAIAADMARAAAAAHAHGIVHRDLKPRNVIVDEAGRARVVDFGIAFDARRGDDPFAGRYAGSPPYMAPEQVLQRRVGPGTDIWSIGVILHEMLTGERPFRGDSVEALFAAIALHEPGPPSGRRAGIHSDIDAVVQRCLAKEPAARFQTAGALLETLTAIAEGKPVASTSIPSYAPKTSALPASKPGRATAKKHLVWTWQLASSPSALWPYVADTDRFNKAVGLDPVVFTDEATPDGPVKRTGEVRVFGLQVTWREYPFEWIRGREHSVFRAYNRGPIAALWNRVSLARREGGGTELRHEIWLSPRGMVGQVAVFVEIERRLKAAVDRFYRHLDEVLSAGTKVDPFEAAFVPSAEQRAFVARACTRLHREGFRSALVEKLAMHLLSAPDGAVATLRPYELADAWGADRAETLDAFVHAARVDLLEPGWDVICPKCMIAHESVTELAEVTRTGSCHSCATTFERDLSDSVELVFAPHPSLRRIPRETFCVGSPAKRPHIVAQQVLEPGEEREVTIDLPRGVYRAGSAIAKGTCEIVASAVGFEERCVLTTTGARIEARPTILLAGPIRFLLRNEGKAEDTIRIETAAVRDAVSAAAAITHPSFRTFFSKQLLSHGERIRVRQLAFLFVELVSPQALFDEVGDGEACAQLAGLDAIVAEEARRHEGDVVPSSLSIVVVAFASPLHAIRAALELRKRLAAEASRPVGIALHDGRCIALTRADRPEFFGETLHRGQALLLDCPRHGIVLSTSVMSDHAVALAAHESGLGVGVDTAKDGPYAGRRLTVLMPPS